jgi:hypothetical protein
MAAAPVAALVAESDVAIAVIDAAIVADVRAPVATVKTVAVIVVAPVAGSPECTLVGSLDPPAGHPVITALTPCPVAGRPEIAVAGSRGLIIVGQWRRRLSRVGHRLNAVTGVIRALIVRTARAGPRGALPALLALLAGAVRRGRRSV